MKKFSNKLKRGISLVEVIVSIFIITLISAAATTIIITSAKNDQTNLRDTQIALSTKNVVDCFRFADNFDEFYSTLQSIDEDYTSSDETITLTKEHYSLRITVDSVEKKVVAITIMVLDNDGNNLSTESYTKG